MNERLFSVTSTLTCIVFISFLFHAFNTRCLGPQWALLRAGARRLCPQLSPSPASAFRIVPRTDLRVFSQASLLPVHHAMQRSLSDLAQIDSFSVKLFSTPSGELLDIPWVPVYLVGVAITAHIPWHFAMLTYTSIPLYVSASPLRADTTIYLPLSLIYPHY